jgi:hypothetical protein
MDFKDKIKQLGDRVETLKDNLQTEEATKMALIAPFISALGYDVFNPTEVVPEMSCDIGTKKGEKIDYAILQNGEPIILIECKHWQQNLNLHDNQLLRYFHVSKAKFGILTNGIVYRFYTDLAEPNKMDEKPFLEVNILDLKDAQIEELKKFHKSYFDVNMILSSANELKYMGELKNVIAKEFTQPSAEFVRYFGKQVYEGVFQQKILDQFSNLVKRSISNYINDIIADRLKVAINNTGEEVKEAAAPSVVEIAEEEPQSKIVTTDEELEGYYIVKSIVRNVLSADRITYRDKQSYFGILCDDNNRKCICRLAFNHKQKYIIFVDNKVETKYPISTLDDIYNYSKELQEIAQKFK